LLTARGGGGHGFGGGGGHGFGGGRGDHGRFGAALSVTTSSFTTVSSETTAALSPISRSSGLARREKGG
jgi:hypothetical protein